MSDPTNIAYKLICRTLKLTSGDAVDIIKAGGLAVSKTQADAWKRASDSTKNATGTSWGNQVSRYRSMPDDAFEALVHGLTDNKFKG